jgi:cell division protein FtsB
MGLRHTMHQRQPRRWLRPLLQERWHRLIIWGGLACFLLLGLLAVIGDRGFLELYAFTRHLGGLEAQIEALERENAQLRQQVVGLRSDPDQIEKVAREELGLARPDELVFIIVDAPKPAP